MAKRRILKKEISYVAGELFTEALATAIDSRKLISTHRGGGEIQLLPDGHINDAQHGHTFLHQGDIHGKLAVDKGG